MAPSLPTISTIRQPPLEYSSRILKPSRHNQLTCCLILFSVMRLFAIDFSLMVICNRTKSFHTGSFITGLRSTANGTNLQHFVNEVFFQMLIQILPSLDKWFAWVNFLAHGPNV